MRSARCSRAGRKTRSSPGLPADRRLRSRRSRPAVGLNFPWIAIARQRREFFSRRGTEQPLERPSRSVGQFPNRQHADFGQPRPGDRPHAPHQLDGQVVEEFQLGAGSTTTSPSGLATWEAILARLRARGGFWREAALLPIAQACRADGKAEAEFLLHQIGLGADCLRVDLCRDEDLMGCGIGLATRDCASFIRGLDQPLTQGYSLVSRHPRRYRRYRRGARRRSS